METKAGNGKGRGFSNAEAAWKRESPFPASQPLWRSATGAGRKSSENASGGRPTAHHNAGWRPAASAAGRSKASRWRNIRGCGSRPARAAGSPLRRGTTRRNGALSLARCARQDETGIRRTRPLRYAPHKPRWELGSLLRFKAFWYDYHTSIKVTLAGSCARANLGAQPLAPRTQFRCRRGVGRGSTLLTTLRLSKGRRPSALARRRAQPSPLSAQPLTERSGP